MMSCQEKKQSIFIVLIVLLGAAMVGFFYFKPFTGKQHNVVKTAPEKIRTESPPLLPKKGQNRFAPFPAEEKKQRKAKKLQTKKTYSKRNKKKDLGRVDARPDEQIKNTSSQEEAASPLPFGLGKSTFFPPSSGHAAGDIEPGNDKANSNRDNHSSTAKRQSDDFAPKNIPPLAMPNPYVDATHWDGSAQDWPEGLDKEISSDLPQGTGAKESEEDHEKIQKTPFALDLWGYAKNAAKGDIIYAYTPAGIPCGKARVNDDEGQYGTLIVYTDDPLTAAVEGLIDGEEITFKINGRRASPQGPEEAVCQGSLMGGLRQVDLEITGTY